MKKFLLFLMPLFLLAESSRGQVNNYSFSYSVGTYTAIFSGTQLIAANTDDGNSAATNIGFDFEYNGSTFTQFVANSNGSIRLGSVGPTSAYSPISTTSNTNAIAFFGRDGRAGGAVVYEITGSDPNRVLTIEYPGYYPAFGSATTFIDAQIKLFESSNEIQLVYGSSTRTTSYTAQVGLRGNAIATDYHNRSTATNWATTTFGATSSATITLSPTVFPVSGTTYTFTPPTPCMGIPDPGNTLTSSNSVCSGVNFTLSLENATSGAGVTYQWQSSPDGNDPWTDLGTSETQVTSQTSSTWYRSTVTCTYSSESGTSTPVYVSMAPFFNCYCITDVGPTSTVDSDLFRVEIAEAGFDHNVGCTGILGVQDFTGLGAITLTQGNTYTMFITMGQCGTGTYINVAKAWIDFGHDGIFDEPAEQIGVVQGATSSTGVAYSFSFTVPAGATLGETRMRVMQRETEVQGDVTPCASFSWGSVHDYAVNIVVGSNDVLSWYNLQWPPSANISILDNVTVYAQCWEPGVTEAAGPGAGIECWIGYNTVDATDVTDFAIGWTWVSADYNYLIDPNNNDEYSAEIGADQGLGVGTYYYVSRFRYNNGPFTYGGYQGGGWDGVNNVSGVLTVTCPSYSIPFTEDFSAGIVPPACWSQTVTNANYTWQAGMGEAIIPWNYSQDESLITPEIEITQTPAMLQFDWMTSYTWLVNPNDNADLECYISINNGGWLKVWDEEMEGVFDNFVWYTESIYLENHGVQSGDFVKVRFRYVGDDAGDAHIDNVAIIQSPAVAVWNGSINNDWFTPGNWSSNVPGMNTDVTIPAGLTNYPIVDNNLAYCNDIFFGSNGTSTATILDNGLLTVNGTASVQRFFSGNDIDWHLVSSPVSNALAGVFMAMYLQSFDEATNSYTEIEDETTPLNVMEGYGLYSTLGATNTVTFNGNLNLGTQNKGFTADGMGWNLMGNPFASSIDWEEVTIPGNLSNEVHYIEAATGNDLSYVKGVGGSGSQYIPPMQGFFVSATGVGTLSIGDAQRSHAGANIFYKSSNPNLVVLKATNGLYSDEAWIHFNELAGAEHDGQFDAHKRISLSNPLLPQIFSYTPAGMKLSVNGLPEIQSVPVGFTAVQSGEFTISAKETGGFTGLFLEDLFSGSVANIQSDDYTFNFNAGDQMDRFILHFTPLSVADDAARNVNIWSYGNEVIVMAPELTNGHVKVYNMMGQEVVSSGLISGRNVIMVPKAGNYVVALFSNEVTITEKVVIK